MKKLFALALVVLGLAACQTEPNELDVNVGGEVLTTVNISIPETDTRSNSALGAFENVDLDGDLTIRYILQVFTADGQASSHRDVKYEDDKSVAFDVRLIPGRDYKFVCWADIVSETAKADVHYKTDDLTNIELIGDWNAMDETRDAFTVSEPVTNYNGASVINIELKRPFAKLRVKTTDLVELGYFGVVPTTAEVTYLSSHRDAFDAFQSQAKDADLNDKTHVYRILPYGDNNETTMTLFTDYFFAEDDVVKFTLSVYEDEAKTKLIKSNTFNTDINVKRNFLTTISGNILTDGNNVKVDIVDAFDCEKNWPDENESAEQLAYAAMFGGEVTLTEDVTLTEPLTIAEGANAVINLNGKTISNATGYAVENYGKLTISGNGAVNGMGGIRSHGGEVTINGGTYTGASRWDNGTYQHILKAVNTKVVINGGTFDATIQGMTNAMINVSENSVVTINGGTFKNVNGVIPQFAPYMFTYEKNGKLIINDGEFYGGWRFNGETTTTDIYGGNFTVSYDGQSFHANSTHVLTVYGGVFDLNNGGKLNPTSHCATGYKAIAADGIYYVLSETIANVAVAEGVTAVTESPADVATALATNNGEATLFMWNDVAYIAKYGKVVIFSDADEATTVRGVVESSTGLTSATVADGIEVVGNRTFRKCANLETVALPNTLTEIGPAVFQSCSKLANITIPESVTTIGEGAFAECTALTSINIPAGVTRIEADALRATGLVSVEFHEGVTYFGAQAFRDCKQLKEVVINAPEFTVEANAFGVMSGALPRTTIYVANAEMKAYLESTLAYENQFTIVAPEVVASTDDLKAALTTDAKMVSVAKGEYTFPASSVKAGQTIICEEGTVFTGTSGLNINGATVIGAEFKNENGVAVSGTINGTFKNCTFTGNEALRWCYSVAGNTTVFENCVIKTDFRGFHYDDMNGDVIFRNCEINGFNAYGGDGTATFEGCTFGCDQSSYNGLNIYSNTKLVNCTFNYVSGKTNFIDMECTGKTLTITNCTATLNGANVDIKNYVGGSKLAQNTVIFN